MKRLILCIALGTLAACGGSGSSQEPRGPDQGLLSKVTNSADLEASIKAGFTTIRSDESVLAATGALPASDNFTGTYTQELNVDEFDTVKYDGSRLFIAPRLFTHCCFALNNAALSILPPQPAGDRSIRILETDPASGTAVERGTIDLDESTSVQGMYVSGDRMVALTSTWFYGSYGDHWADVAIWAPEKTGLRIYDVSDPSTPELEFDALVDGTFVDSRRIGNTLYLVSRYSPQVPGIAYNVTTPAEQAGNQAILANYTLEDLLPKITIDGVPSSLVDPENCYIPTTEPGYPVITSITAIPIDNPSAYETTCYNEAAQGIYVSENSIYFTDVRFDDTWTRSRTRIHKFRLAGTGATYSGSGEIAGQVWRGGQQDFRMSEHGGDLRVFTSEYDWNDPDFVDHHLFVLRESSTRPDLDTISELPNATRPAEIGKPGEELFGVRFLGDRAFAVTFERIDPLYAIDLSDPTDPFVAGELTVAGFSQFLHPVSNDLLLGIGSDDVGGIKLELFDVSDMSAPVSQGAEVLGDRWSFSEATHDRHAFTYLADVGGVDRFAIPATIYDSGQFSLDLSGLYLFEIHDKTTPALASLVRAGSITPPVNGIEIPYINRNRSFFHDDTVFYVRDDVAWAASWLSPTIVNGPF